VSDEVPAWEGESLPLTLAGSIDRACDRYEAEWKAGRRPQIEAHLAESPEHERPALLRELMLLEIEFRMSCGESPTAAEYRARFPEHDALVASVFDVAALVRDAAANPPTTNGAGADRDLMLGVLALEMGLVTRDVLADTMRGRAPDEPRSLGQILMDKGELTAEAHAQLEAMVDTSLKAHTDAANHSTTALDPARQVRTRIGRLVRNTIAAPPTTVGAKTSSGSRFRILRLHDRGGLGDVYAAQDEELNRVVALKSIQGRFANHSLYRARFQFEAEITGGLEHPGIVPVYGLGHYDDGRPFYAMRFIKGDSLATAIDRFHAADVPHRDPGERTLELRKLLGRFIDVCDALEYAHSRGILHRDLKPGNIMLGKYGETLVVDWGLAKSLDRPELPTDSNEPLLHATSASGLQETAAGTPIGTPAYMSPEQAAGRHDQLGRASDVYGLGATLYQLLTGQPPVIGETRAEISRKVIAGDIARPRSIQPRISPPLEAICEKAIALEPADRYRTPRALAEEIEHWLADEPVSAYPDPWFERLSRWTRRHRPLVAGAAALLVTSMVALAIGTTLVEAARRAEAQAHGIADRARRDEIEARRQAENQLYLSNVALAGREWLAGNVSRVEELLNECSPARRHWEWRYLKRQCNSALVTLAGQHFGPLTALAFSPDGGRLVSVGYLGTVKVWDAAEGRVVLDLEVPNGHTGHVRAAAYSPDGKRIATAGDDQTVRLWDALGGTPGLVYREHPAAVTSLAFSPDGDWLASASRDGGVRLWSPSTGETKLTLRGHTAAVTSVAFSPDGRRLATAGEHPDMDPRLWSVETGEEIRRFPGHIVNVNSLAFRPDGLRLASAGNDGVILIWDVESGKSVGVLPSERRRPVNAVAYSPDGKLLASGGLDQSARIWDATTYRELLTQKGHASGLTCVAFRPDSLRLASGSEDGLVKIWDATNGSESTRVAAERAVRDSGLAFSPDSRWVAYASAALAGANHPQGAGRPETLVHLHEAADGKPGPVLRGHPEDVVDLVFNSAGTRLAAAGMNGVVTLWEVPSGRKLLALRTKSVPAAESMKSGRVQFGPEAGQLAFLDQKGAVTVWETTGGREVQSFRVFDRSKLDYAGRVPLEFAFSPDGRLVASGELDAIRLWDVATGEEHSILRGGLAGVNALAFSPDGRKLAVGLLKQGGLTSAGEIKIWDLSTGREVVTFAGTVGGTSALAFTPDGKRLCSIGYYHRDLTLWDSNSGRELLALRIDDSNNVGGPGADARVAFCPDGARLALVGRSGLTIWHAPPSPEVLTLRGQVGVWGLAYSPDGRQLATADNHEAVSIRNAFTGRLVMTLQEPDATSNTSFVEARFSPDGKRLAAAIAKKSSGSVTVWNATSGLVEGRLQGHAAHVINVAFSPDGRHLATASHDKTAKIWDLLTREPILTLTGHADRVNAVAYSPDGRQLVSACRDGTVKFWDARNGRENVTWDVSKGSIVSIAFSPDGRFLAAGGGRRSDQPEGPPGEVTIWDMASGRELFNLPGITHFIHTVAFGPDSWLLASGGEDRVVRLWDVTTGRELAVFHGHMDTIKRVTFSPNGRSLASSGEDRTMRVLDVSGWTRSVGSNAVRVDARP
jgi:WD40 repeat protein